LGQLSGTWTWTWTVPLIASLACGSNGGTTTAATPTTGGPAVLFIGNSLTSANDLPGQVRAIAAASGVPTDTASVTMDGASLQDHWDAGRVRERIQSRRWTFVVLQQGPSTLPESRAELIRSTTQYAEEIRRAGARPALLMVWPLPGQTAEAVAASYRAAAEATGALLIPAGEAWVRARTADPRMQLTGPDGFHPSALGTELAAATVVCSVYPRVLPVPVLPLPPAQRTIVSESACER
jgi:hypothetical protein